MNIILRLAVVVGCFFAAIACFVFAAPVGGALFIVAGVIFEGLMWRGVFGVAKPGKH
ncbi:hypothetical protein [Gilvimarinus sp. 1_MG-2023]|nr:hypothetical protein [Gilvimarinus sp. 1_MG-2023]MDO6746576.1 hypothetical protein [Gilvimarinus sp. 1_MG-2023]